MCLKKSLGGQKGREEACVRSLWRSKKEGKGVYMHFVYGKAQLAGCMPLQNDVHLELHWLRLCLYTTRRAG